MSGRKVFTAGEVLQAADVNDFLMDQSVMVFAGTAARGSAIPSPTEGMVTYRSDDDVVEVFDGSAFKAVGVGQILQVISDTKLDTFTTTSASFVDVTGLAVSITPSSTASKVLVIVQLNFSLNNNTGYGHFQLAGGNSGTYVGAAGSGQIQAVFGGSDTPNNGNVMIPGSIVFLDSPATTSATTYKVQARQASAGAVFVNRTLNDNANAFSARGASSITVMEVAG